MQSIFDFPYCMQSIFEFHYCVHSICECQPLYDFKFENVFPTVNFTVIDISFNKRGESVVNDEVAVFPPTISTAGRYRVTVALQWAG